MKTYTIKTPFVERKYKRRDFAADQFLIDVHDAIAAGGQLDTKAGWVVWEACKTMANDVASGAYPMFSFSHPLPHEAGLIQFECN